MSRSAFVSSLLGAALLVAGCGSVEHTGPVARAPERPTVQAAPAAPSTSAPSGASEEPELPAEVVPVQGGQAWAVYLAVADPDEASGQAVLAETAQHLHDSFGYAGSGVGEIGCDQGAAEQLGVDPHHHRVAVYFASVARAQLFLAAYDRREVGSAQVRTYCLD